jgi:glucokinase
MIILAGDIGGTKTNLALYRYQDNSFEILGQSQFVSQNYTDFQEIITSFTTKYSSFEVDALCLGIAGPVIDGVCKTTNLPWTIEASKLQKELDIVNVYLLNDLESTAYGMLYLEDDQFVELNPKAQNAKANKAVIAAGTGLGEAILFYDGTSYHPLGSEGGHADFAPLNPLQDELLVWLRRRYPEHVSVERVLCGDGVATLYDFLQEKENATECETMLQLKSGDDKNAIISQCAQELGDPLCVKTMQLFCEIYGAEAGNVALKSLSLGGIFVGGGIAPKILPFLEDGRFLNAFIAKGRFKEMLEKISIKVSLNQETALLGAAYFARDQLD